MGFYVQKLINQGKDYHSMKTDFKWYYYKELGAGEL